MAIQICFHSIYSHAQISPKIGPFGPYIGPNDPHGGIFPLGNICFYKLGSDRNLWVPLEFCHQGGAWGPLLPTRLRLIGSFSSVIKAFNLLCKLNAETLQKIQTWFHVSLNAFPAFPAHTRLAIYRIWQEAHSALPLPIPLQWSVFIHQ